MCTRQQLHRWCAVATLLLAGACQAPAAPTPEPQVHKEQAQSQPITAPTQAAQAPVYRFQPGASWREDIEIKLFSNNRGGSLPEAPTAVETRRERFAIVRANEQGAELEMTIEQLRFEPAGGQAFDSRELGLPGEPTASAVKGLDSFAVERLALVGVKCLYKLNPRGEVVGIVDEPGYRAAVRSNWESLLAAAGQQPRDPQARFIDDDLTSTREWSLRPVLPDRVLAPGESWTQQLTTSTLFNARVTWALKHVRKAAADGLWAVSRAGDATFNPTASMAKYLRSAAANIHGDYTVDLATGALIESQTTVTATVDAAPQPDAGFDGGLVKMRRVTTRRQVGGT